MDMVGVFAKVSKSARASNGGAAVVNTLTQCELSSLRCWVRRDSLVRSGDRGGEDHPSDA